jgi:branched-chain amino acid transport system ATP-binding protein
MSTPEDINVRQKPAIAATGSGTETLLQTSKLSKKFGGLVAVDDVDISIKRGEIRCLVGPNGAGKSTLLELIVGRLSPSSGNIYFNGENLTQMEIHDRIDIGLSVKFQSPNVYEDLSVENNLRVPLQRTNQDTDTILDQTLERIGLNQKGAKPASELSHGEQQRLEIGMAVTLDPTLMLLDEPVAGMSIEETVDVANLIKSLHRDGMTFLVVEHDMDFVRQISDKVTVLDNGSIFQQGSIKEIEADEDVRKIYLGENK